MCNLEQGFHIQLKVKFIFLLHIKLESVSKKSKTFNQSQYYFILIINEEAFLQA